MTMQTYRQRPVEVEAVQWPGPPPVLTNPDLAADLTRWEAIDAWLARVSGVTRARYRGSEVLLIDPNGLTQPVFPSDWIVRGRAGDLRRMANAEFVALYEPIQPEAEAEAAVKPKRSRKGAAA
jgi:hypothetical protein